MRPKEIIIEIKWFGKDKLLDLTGLNLVTEDNIPVTSVHIVHLLEIEVIHLDRVHIAKAGIFLLRDVDDFIGLVQGKLADLEKLLLLMLES